MEENTTVELSPHLKILVDISVELGTTETRLLAQTLSLSNKTVDTYWKRIKSILNVDTRYDVIRLAREGRIYITENARIKI